MPPQTRQMLTVAERVAEELAGWGVTRIHGLCGGHIQPMWDAVSRQGIEILDVRHESGAVFGAHAEAKLTDGLAVCMVTAGPGFTNALTAIANAAKSGVAVLVIAGRPPRAQLGLGAMQEIPQAEMTRTWAPFAKSVHSARAAIPLLRQAAAAALGNTASEGPAILELPTDVQKEKSKPESPPTPHVAQRVTMAPAPSALDRGAELIAQARRPVIIGGSNVRRVPRLVRDLLDRTGALYLDTSESRGALRPAPNTAVPALRGQAMGEADLVVTLGRCMDFQLAYGSRAVFNPKARFLRLGRSFSEIFDAAAGETALVGDLEPTLSKLLERKVVSHSLDRDWVQRLMELNKQKVGRLQSTINSAPTGTDGRMHPFTLIAALNDWLEVDAVTVVDGGDILSFGRVALKETDYYLDCGPYGTLGVGVPFGLSAALCRPTKQAFALVGDGSLGFTAMELYTAAKHGAGLVTVVANNEAWNIERHDQLARFDGNLVGVELEGLRYDKLARACGLHAERIEDPTELPAALNRAGQHTPALLDVMITRDATSSDFRNGLASVPDYQALEPWDAAERENMFPEAGGS